MLACLIVMTPLHAETGTRFPVRLCSVADRQVCGLGRYSWEPSITAPPSLGVQFWNGDFLTGTDAGRIGFTFNLQQTVKSHPEVRKAVWNGADVQVFLGRVGAPWPWRERFKGKITNYAGGEWPDMQITATVDTEPFEVDVLTAKYAGTGDAEGGEDLKDRVKPLAIGRPRNVEPVLIDSVNSVYQFSAYGAIEAVETLYERASAFPASSGDHADYDALVAADIDPGHWATCLAEGLVRLGAPAFGVITGDIRGHAVGGVAPCGAGALVQTIATIAGIEPSLLSAIAFDALDAEGATASDVVITEQVKFLEAARRLVLPCNWQVLVSNTGILQALKPRFAESYDTDAFTLHAQGAAIPLVKAVTERATSFPYKITTMAAERCWRVHSFDEIATEARLIDRGDYDAETVYREGNIVTMPGGDRWVYVSTTPQKGVTPGTNGSVWESLEAKATYTDGTFIDDLKPEEQGANVTETRTSLNTNNVGTNTSGEVNDAVAATTAGLNADGTVKDDKVSTDALATNSATLISSFFKSYSWTIGSSGTWVTVDDGSDEASISVLTGSKTAQQIFVDAYIGITRAGSSNDIVFFRMIRDDGTVLPQVYDIEATNDKAVQPFAFLDADPDESVTHTYALQMKSDDSGTPIYEVFLKGLLAKTG